jgi:hypothetical protein
LRPLPFAAYSGEGDQPFLLIVITESGDRDHAQGGPKSPGVMVAAMRAADVK